MSFAKTLSDQYGNLKQQNIELKQKLKKEMTIPEKSQLINDLKQMSLVECLDQITQIEDLRMINENIRLTDLRGVQDKIQELSTGDQQKQTLDINNDKYV